MAVNFAKRPRLAERTTTARRPPRAAPTVATGVALAHRSGTTCLLASMP
jgi:hypothetical protein